MLSLGSFILSIPGSIRDTAHLLRAYQTSKLKPVARRKAMAKATFDKVHPRWNAALRAGTVCALVSGFWFSFHPNAFEIDKLTATTATAANPPALTPSNIPPVSTPTPPHVATRAEYEASKKKENTRFRKEIKRLSDEYDTNHPITTTKEKTDALFAQLRKEGFHPSTTSSPGAGTATFPVREEKPCDGASGLIMNHVEIKNTTVAGIRLGSQPCASLTDVKMENTGLYGIYVDDKPTPPVRK
jgi:hypothetical protein